MIQNETSALRLHKTRQYPTDIEVDKVIRHPYLGSEDRQSDIQQYERSQQGAFFLTSKVTRQHDGSICDLEHLSINFFNITRFKGQQLTRSMYPLKVAPGTKYARANGFIPWRSTCKLWLVNDSNCENQTQIILTFGGYDEVEVRRLQDSFTQLPWNKRNDWFYYDEVQNRWHHHDCFRNRMHVHLCVLIQVRVTGLRWDFVEKGGKLIEGKQVQRKAPARSLSTNAEPCLLVPCRLRSTELYSDIVKSTPSGSQRQASCEYHAQQPADLERGTPSPSQARNESVRHDRLAAAYEHPPQQPSHLGGGTPLPSQAGHERAGHDKPADGGLFSRCVIL